MTLEEVLSRFENPQRNGKGFKVRCPSHEDVKNSLSVCANEDGKILLKCMAGCSTKSVIDAVKLTWRDLGGSAETDQQRLKNDHVAARYVYVDENRKPLFQVSRTRSKDFFQSRFDLATRKFIPGMGDVRRVLYHLPDVIQASMVYIVEGEKDADKLASLGFTATTNAGGAGKWDRRYTDTLKGKDIVLFPDNDEPGQSHALTVAKLLLAVAKSVKIVSLPDLPPKGDVSDYLETHKKEDLLALVDSAALFTGVTDRRGQANVWPEFLTAKEILQAPKDPKRWIVADCLPVGGASVLVAKPKVGKSTIAADLAISVARGEPFLGRATQQSPVAYVFLDGPLTDIADTFVGLGLHESDPVFIHAGSAPADAITWILAAVKDKGARLVIIDVLQKLCRFENINDYSEVTTKMEPLLEAARNGNCHVMTLHHAKKDSKDDLDAAIGSTAIRGLCYTYIFAKRLAGSERRILSSDQRGGKNFSEVGVGFDHVTGRLLVQGTIDEVEIEEAIPLIKKVLDGDGEQGEGEIRKAVPMRAWIVGRALRGLVKKGHVDRTGTGKKGNAFRYSLASVLCESDTSNVMSRVGSGNPQDSLPGRGILKGGTDSSPYSYSLGNGVSGLESEKQAQHIEKTKKDSSPKTQDENGTSGTGINFDEASGLESGDGWEPLS